MTPLIPVAVVGTGLYLLFRKKAAAPTPFPTSNVAAALAPGALSVPAPAAAPAQSAEDRAVVDAAFAEFAKEQGARINADPILFEQPAPRVSAPTLSSAAIPVTPQDFLAPGAQPVGQEEVEEPGILDVANSVFNPFASGNLFGDD